MPEEIDVDTDKRRETTDEEVKKTAHGNMSLASTSALGAAAFTILSIAVDRGATRKYDKRARRIVGPRRRRRLTGAAKITSHFAAAHTHPLVAIAIARVASRHSGRGALSIPLASVGALIVDRGVRFLIHQQRPPGATHHPGRDKFGFPSGHTCAATAIAFASVAQTRPYVSASAHRAVTAAAIGAALVVGWSRLYLDEHWIDDVVGGWIAGIAVGAASVATVRAVGRSRTVSGDGSKEGAC